MVEEIGMSDIIELFNGGEERVLIFTLHWSFCLAVGICLLNVVLKVTRYS